MYSDLMQGRLKQLRGTIKQVWGRATDDRLLVSSGERDWINGRIQVRAARTEAARNATGAGRHISK